jgi:hypothetical protein
MCSLNVCLIVVKLQDAKLSFFNQGRQRLGMKWEAKSTEKSTLEKLIAAQLAKTLPYFHITQKFITIFKEPSTGPYPGTNTSSTINILLIYYKF